MRLLICASLLATSLLATSPGSLASSVDLKTQLLSCQQILNEEQRLSCFDQVVQQLQQLPVTSTTSQTPEIVAAPVLSTPAAATATAAHSAPITQQDPLEEFGKRKRQPVDDVEEFRSEVSKVELNARKKMLITLSNGQQWQQTDQEILDVQPGKSCVVKRAALGSFKFGIDGVTKKIRVKRVR